MHIRTLLFSLLLALSASAGIAPRSAYAAPLPATVVLVADLPHVDVDVDVHKHKDWYKNPVIVGMGAAIIVLLIVIAARR
jgi:hypothetical protein